MKIIVVGAAGGEVTGSAYFVETSEARVLIDGTKPIQQADLVYGKSANGD